MRRQDSAYVEVDGAQVAYASFGRGEPTVLLLPHWSTNIEALWQEPAFVRFGSKLSGLARVVHFDKRGVGLSDRLPGDALPDLETATDDALAVLDACGVRAAVVVAADLAGMSAIHLASQAPDRVSALVLIGATARLRRADDYPVGFNAATMDRAIAATHDAWISGDDASVHVQAPSRAGDSDYIQATSAYRRLTMSPSRARSMAEQLASWDVRVDAAAVRCPAVVVHRQGDRYLPASHGRLLAATIGGARYIELEGADHTPWVGPHDEILDVIATVLEEAGGAPPRPERDVASPRPRFGWDALTEAEQRVVGVLAGGATNKEAAAALGVSARTVESQVQAAYRKLGIRTRAELALEVSQRAGSHPSFDG